MLGPPFFLLDINNIPKCIDGADITLFADDTSVLLNESLETVKEKAEKCLKSLCECFTSNKLTLSTEKNFFIIHHSKRKQISPQYDYLRIKNSVIKRVNHVKYLGVFLDEHLSWEILILQLYNSLARYFLRFYYLFLKFLCECFTSNKLTLSTEKKLFHNSSL